MTSAVIERPRASRCSTSGKRRKTPISCTSQPMMYVLRRPIVSANQPATASTTSQVTPDDRATQEHGAVVSSLTAGGVRWRSSGCSRRSSCSPTALLPAKTSAAMITSSAVPAEELHDRHPASAPALGDLGEHGALLHAAADPVADEDEHEATAGTARASPTRGRRHRARSAAMRAMTPEASSRPSGTPICGDAPNGPRLSAGACSTAMRTAPPHSPPAETPCTMRSRISRIGAHDADPA